jgi:hypothetical protein
MDLAVEQHAMKVAENSAAIRRLKDTKLDQTIFWDKHRIILEDVSVIRKACADNFNVQLATDNYIEKYLPFAT